MSEKAKENKFSFYGRDPSHVYLDNAASTLALQGVKDAVDEFLATYGSLHSGSGINSKVSTAAYEDARRTIGKWIDATKDDCVIFTANTTDAINKFCLIYPWKPGDTVLVTDVEQSANYMPWLKFAPEVQTVSPEKYILTADQVEAELEKNPRIRIVAVAGASNVTGYMIDAKSIHEACRAHGAWLFLDESQYAPHCRPSLNDCDFMAYSGHKMYAPFGAGVLAGRLDVLSNEGMSPAGGGNEVYIDREGKPYYKPAPFMHEAGTQNGSGAIAMAKAHDILYEDQDFLAAHNAALLDAMDAAVPVLEEAGYKVIFPEPSRRRAPILVFRNTRKSQEKTVALLQRPVSGYLKDVFVQEMAFCSYRLIEKALGLDGRNAVRHGKLDPSYSLIRLSGGLLSEPEDFAYAAAKLAAINRI